MGIKRIGRWGERRPFAFALLFCVPLALLFLTIASVFGEIGRHQFALGHYVGVSLALLLGSVAYLLLIRRFGWTEAAGMCRPPSISWLVIVPPLLYIVTVNFYVSSGTFDLELSDIQRAALLSVRMMSTGLFEEVVFRGTVLTAMLLAWGTTRKGVVMSLVVSSLLFGGLHLLNATTGAPATKVVANSIYTCLTGLLFGGIAIRCHSFWPAVLLHGVSNSLLSLNRLGEPPPEWTISYAVLRVSAHIPLGLYGLCLMRSHVPDSVNGRVRRSPA
jgi:membrane protease YdiL (CAAX protease family)